jgi:hypothetical protein
MHEDVSYEDSRYLSALMQMGALDVRVRAEELSQEQPLHVPHAGGRLAVGSFDVPIARLHPFAGMAHACSCHTCKSQHMMTR